LFHDSPPSLSVFLDYRDAAAVAGLRLEWARQAARLRANLKTVPSLLAEKAPEKLQSGR